MARKRLWIAAGLSVLMMLGCFAQPAVEVEPEQEKIQIVGQIDTAVPTEEAVQAQLITPAPLTSQAEGAKSASSGSASDENVTGVPTETPAPADTPEPTETPAPADTPEPTETPASTDTPEPTGTPTPDRTKGEQLCDVARSLLDTPYVRGGTTTEGFDPGGFTYYCLNAVGVKVRHKTSKGYSEFEEWMRVDSMDDLVPGDLCFFITSGNDSVNCVCIYLGEGKMIYPSSSKGAVIITSIRSDYWTEAFAFARRVF